jgi:hypothetical protein
MPVTVRGGDILFNDGTTQSTAAGALNTTAVLNATAGASVGEVGTYGFFVEMIRTNHTYTPGTTLAGSSLRYASAFLGAGTLATSNIAPAGTWRLMGWSQYQAGDYFNAAIPALLSVWLRIS